MDLKKLLQNRKLHLIVIIFITLLAYINILQNGFAWDDRDFFIDWPQIKSEEGAPAYLSLPFLLSGDLPLNHRGVYRPVRSVYYLVSYTLWGENVIGYHIQAIIIHILIVLVVYLITEIITKKRPLAFIVTALFATHPIHTEAVSYTTASMDTLGILFFFLSFYFYLKMQISKMKKNIFLFASVIYGLLAFLTYEMTLVLPFLIILYDFCSNRFSFKSIFHKINIYKYYILSFIFYFFIRFLVLGIGNRADYLGSNWEIAANQARVGMPEIFGQYVWLLLWPINLNISHELTINLLLAYIKLLNNINPTGNLVLLSSKVAFLFPIIYILLGLLLIYKLFKKHPLVFFGFSWFVIALLPVSDIIPQGASMAERFLYIPSYGFTLLLGLLFYNGFQILNKSRQQLYKYLSYVLILFFIAIICFYTFQTSRRNLDWKNEETIWLSAIKVDPTQPRPYAALGVAYTKEGQLEKGISMLSKALELNQPSAKLNADLGLIYEKQGNITKAIDQYKEALKLDPNFYLAHLYLGNIYLQRQRDFNLAEQEYKDALIVKKNDPIILSYLGNVYYNQKQFDEALKTYLEALSFDQNSDVLYYKIGFTYFRLLKYDSAIQALNKSLSLNPKQPLVYLGLADCFGQKDEKQKAKEILEKGFELTKDQKIKEELSKLNN